MRTYGDEKVSEKTKEIMNYVENASREDILELVVFLESKQECNRLAQLIKSDFSENE